MVKAYWLATTYACGLIEVTDGIITKTCPIYRRFVGREAKAVGRELRQKGLWVDAKELG